MKRKRGAQPGNKNSFKHGFYSSHFKSQERRMLDRMPTNDLAGEIEFMRVSLKRFLEACDASPQPPDLETQISILRVKTLSAESINSMMRTQIMLSQITGGSDEIMARLNELSDDPDVVSESSNEA